MFQNNKTFGLYIYFFALCTYIILNVHVCLNPSRGDRCYVRGGKSANCYTADLWTWFLPHFRFSSATLVVLREIPLRLLHQVSDTITETIPTERDLCVKWQDPNCYQKHKSRPRRSRVESSRVEGGIWSKQEFISKVMTEYVTDFDNISEATSVKTHHMRDFRVRLFFEWDLRFWL